MALTSYRPHWSQSRAAHENEDASQFQTSSGGIPGRVRGVSVRQAMDTRRAFRQRTAIAPNPGPMDFAREQQRNQKRANRQKRRAMNVSASTSSGSSSSPSVAPAAPVSAAKPSLPGITPLTAAANFVMSKLSRPKPAKITRENSPALDAALKAAETEEKKPEWQARLKPAPKAVAVVDPPRPPTELERREADYKRRQHEKIYTESRPSQVARVARNAAMVEKYRAGDRAFAATATPSQKAQADSGFSKLMSKRQRRTA